ncbi:hypothetical protein MKQ70_02670 [Chitinophaga sedimenti]|nr:hypothetical protein [Chitinophaga sedimenti]MCK7553968.1 hypothetical protein [Chitinophaga sedimenti]
MIAVLGMAIAKACHDEAKNEIKHKAVFCNVFRNKPPVAGQPAAVC